MSTLEVSTNFRRLLKVRHEARRIAIREADPKEETWFAYGDIEKAPYEVHFWDVLGDETLRSYVDERRKPGQGFYALDLMGPGAVLRYLAIDGGLAVTLGDRRTKEEQDTDNKRDIEIITGDILSKPTWRKVKDWLINQKIVGFDLVLCRPIGGFSTIPPKLGIHYFLISQI